ncbi:MAG: hypothetical protein Q7U04_07205, partial [Bacteriovorax sp.]|nr:hypothetical protein [Bacteriovorax sp.]
KTTELFARPYSNGTKSSFANPDWQCRSKESIEEDQKQQQLRSYYYQQQSTQGGANAVQLAKKPLPKVNVIASAKNDLESLNDLRQSITSKEKEIEKKYKVPFNDPLNPLKSFNFSYLSLTLDNCIAKQKYNLTPCQIEIKPIVDYIKSIAIDRAPTKDEKSLFQYNNQLIVVGKSPITLDVFQNIAPPAPLRYGSYGSQSYGPYGSGGGIYGVLESQYALREGDNKKWTLNDVEYALKECKESLKQIKDQMNISKTMSSQDRSSVGYMLTRVEQSNLDTAFTAITELKKLSGKDYEAKWTIAQPFLTQLSKVCLGLEDLYVLSKDNSVVSGAVREYKCFFGSLKILDNGMELAMKDIVRETMLTEAGANLLQYQFDNAYGAYITASLGLTPAPPPSATIAKSIPKVKIEEGPASYCPNKTAEMIEDLLKNNNCIETVFVPDKWLLNRLNEFGNKVQFRPFAEEDKYAIEVEKTQCN